MEITIRRAVKEDCPRLMELVQELAEYEKAPDEVTFTLAHFEESGFGTSPIWWAFVAEAEGVVLDVGDGRGRQLQAIDEQRKAPGQRLTRDLPAKELDQDRPAGVAHAISGSFFVPSERAT